MHSSKESVEKEKIKQFTQERKRTLFWVCFLKASLSYFTSHWFKNHCFNLIKLFFCLCKVGETGQKTGNSTRVVISGYVRAKGESHVALESILKEKGLYPIQWRSPPSSVES